LLLATRLSVKMRDAAERVSRRKPVRTFLYWGQYTVLTSALLFPLTLYQGFFRERAYGLATQTFGPWFIDRLKELGLSIVLGGISVVVLYGVLLRVPRALWLAGAG